MTVICVDAADASGPIPNEAQRAQVVERVKQTVALARCSYFDGMRRIRDTFGIKTLVRVVGGYEMIVRQATEDMRPGGFIQKSVPCDPKAPTSEEERKKESAIKDIGRDEALRKRVGYMATAQLETESNVRKLERDVAAIGADVAVIRAEKPSAAGLAGTVRKLWKRLSLLEERKNL